ncbi:uncharacterized protein SCHCODRAFT_02487358 [Schizophyllum commune H4-8]|uniref:Uncharacterized protein n=1 Tax=Schizophyllum commune (strain H4-8 / FGSC 9210) TaxID=578458 RepID=D8PMD8_SCHCM|nr:uncharacterized protein SCHCODRAFT_02487358 [Schizophyllum commune H4-8]KAI5898858.1 hypothetical protein SCHCODRAFT_02487358 [Schizophyllum commune H4-8]
MASTRTASDFLTYPVRDSSTSSGMSAQAQADYLRDGKAAAVYNEWMRELFKPGASRLQELVDAGHPSDEDVREVLALSANWETFRAVVLVLRGELVLPDAQLRHFREYEKALLKLLGRFWAAWYRHSDEYIEAKGIEQSPFAWERLNKASQDKVKKWLASKNIDYERIRSKALSGTMKGKGRHAEYREMFKREWPIFLAGVARFVASGGPNGRMNELSVPTKAFREFPEWKTRFTIMSLMREIVKEGEEGKEAECLRDPITAGGALGVEAVQDLAIMKSKDKLDNFIMAAFMTTSFVRDMLDMADSAAEQAVCVFCAMM